MFPYRTIEPLVAALLVDLIPTLVGLTSTESVALGTSGLEETSTLLGVTVLETHFD